MVLALEFGQAVADQTQEVLVGINNTAVQVELDNTHGPVEGLQLAFGLALVLYLQRDVKRIFNHLHHVALLVLDRVVAGLQPNWLAISTHSFKGS